MDLTSFMISFSTSMGRSSNRSGPFFCATAVHSLSRSCNSWDTFCRTTSSATELPTADALDVVMSVGAFERLAA